MNNIFDLTYIS